jgi:D-alanyl-D-alanine carboxypeptidase
MKKFLLLFAIIIFNLATYAQELNTAKLDSLFTLLLENNKSMGSFAIAKDGMVIYKRSIGFTNVKDGKPLPANDKTMYRIGSTTKMYTAAMIYQLVDEGKLTLDTKLDKFYPQIPNAKDITILMLLNHKNGLFDFVNDGEDQEWITEPRTKDELLARIKNNPVRFAPGTNEYYSNSGYLLAAYIIEDVTGKSYDKNLQKRICKKLGLKNTYSPSNTILKNNEAESYWFDENWVKATEIYFTNVVGVGDILATPEDLIVFNEALVAGKLFSTKNMEVMKTIGGSQFGAGIMQIPFYNKTSYGHGGDTGGTHTMVATFPDDKVSVAFSVNGEVYPHNDITIAMLKIIFGKKYHLPKFIEIPAEILDKYTGIYSAPEFPMKVTITRENNMLIAQATGQSSFPLEATDFNKFKFDAAGIVIEFNNNQLFLKQWGDTDILFKE